jgi:hypothetical protein
MSCFRGGGRKEEEKLELILRNSCKHTQSLEKKREFGHGPDWFLEEKRDRYYRKKRGAVGGMCVSVWWGSLVSQGPAAKQMQNL